MPSGDPNVIVFLPGRDIGQAQVGSDAAYAKLCGGCPSPYCIWALCLTYSAIC